MKLVNCILLAGLALGTSLAYAGQTEPACTANPGGSFAQDHSSIKLLDQNGNAIPFKVQDNGGTGSSR